jgi:hypothetical protein
VLRAEDFGDCEYSPEIPERFDVTGSWSLEQREGDPGSVTYQWSEAQQQWNLISDPCQSLPPFYPTACESPVPEDPGSYDGEQTTLDCPPLWFAKTSDDNARLIDTEGVWLHDVRLIFTFWGHVEGDQIRLYFDWTDADNCKYAEALVGPTAASDPVGYGTLTLYEISGGVTTAISSTARLELRERTDPADEGSYDFLAVCITQDDELEDDEGNPRLLITAAASRWTTFCTSSTATYAKIQSSQIGLGVGSIGGTIRVDDFEVERYYDPDHDTYQYCPRCTLVSQAACCEAAEADQLEVTVGTQTNDLTDTYTWFAGEEEDNQSLQIACTAEGLDVEFQFSLAAPHNPLNIRLRGRWQTGASSALSCEVYNAVLQQWELPPWLNIRDALGSGLYSQHLRTALLPTEENAQSWFIGVHNHHVDGSGVVRLRFRSEETSGTLYVSCVRAGFSYSVPTTMGVDLTCSTYPELDGHYVLDRDYDAAYCAYWIYEWTESETDWTLIACLQSFYSSPLDHTNILGVVLYGDTGSGPVAIGSCSDQLAAPQPPSDCWYDDYAMITCPGVITATLNAGG